LFNILENSPSSARTKHANPEADEAIPEAVGKELTD
jgi:hypothetical protein